MVSIGDEGGFLLATEARDAVEGARERDVLTVVVVVVDLVLVAEGEDNTRERPAEVGVTSDLAVSKAVELSLVDDIVEDGRDSPDGGRSVEGPGVFLRIVEACDLTVLVDATDERIRLDPSLVEAAVDTCRRVGLVENDVSSLCAAPDLAEGDTSLPV